MKSIYEKLLFLLLMFPLSMLAQSTLQGTVIDSRTKQSIPGVNVNVQGSTNGTSTDFDGKFKISKLKSGDKIIFSFIGYKNETIDFTGQSSVSVQLNEDSNKLQEVVVQVGYGNVKKKDATGSVTTISTKDFNKGANVSAENLLNGRVAGVTINSGGGAPGSGSQIRIRGGSSLAASNDPLIVIDGLPLSSVTNEGSTSILAALNPNDIESFNILKDASATAIYGSRASNGVIIITTKRGGKKLSVDYNFQYGSGKVVKTLDVLGSNDFRNLVKSRFPAAVGSLGNADTDWQKEIYRRTDFIDNNIAIKGNLFGKVPARLSIGNTYQEGLRLTNYFNRTTVSTSLSPSFLNDHLKLKFNGTFTSENNRFAEGVEAAAISFNPTQPVYKAGSPFAGFFEYYVPAGAFNNLNTQAARNPVAQLLNTNDLGKNNRVFGNFEIDYKFHFLPTLRGVVNVGFDQSNGQRTKEIGLGAGNAAYNDVGGNQNFYGNDEYKTKVLRNKLFDAYLVYNTKFGKTNLELTGGYSYQKFEEYSSDFGNSRTPAALITQAVPFNRVFTDNIILGYFGRANISYNDRFLLTLSARRDGSSVLPKQNRYLFTPGVALAYKDRKSVV